MKKKSEFEEIVDKALVDVKKISESILKEDELKEIIRLAQISVLREVVAKGDYRMGSTGLMAGAHYGELKKKLKELEK